MVLMETTSTEAPIPATCIPDLSVSFDLNRDWPCKRAQFVHFLSTRLAEIKRVERETQSMRTSAKRGRLTLWAADARVRLAGLYGMADETPCTCKESGLYG